MKKYIVLVLFFVFALVVLFSNHLIVFNDFVLFTGYENRLRLISNTWSVSSFGTPTIPNLLDVLLLFFEFIGRTPLVSQFLFLYTFALIGYFGFARALTLLNIKNSWIVLLLPLLYVFNPNTFLYSTGVWVFYNLVPVFFVLFFRLTQRYNYRLGFPLSVIVAIFLSNYQIMFWNVGWLYLIGLIFVLIKQIPWQNYAFIVGHTVLGLLFNISSLQSLFGYVSHLGGVSTDSYIQSIHGCYRAVFWNLARIGSNGCNIEGALGYIKDSWWNITGYILIVVIAWAALWRAEIIKSLTKSQRQIAIYSVSFVLFSLVMILLLRYHALDFLVRDNNAIIISLRNPVKLLEPFAFHYLLIFGFCLSVVLSKLSRAKSIALGMLVVVCLLVYNHPFLLPGWKYDTMNTQNYWVKFAGEGSYWRTQKYDTLDEQLAKIGENERALYLPFDYSISAKTRYQQKLFRDTSDAMRQQSSGNIAKKIYTDVCHYHWENLASYEANLNYVVVDKHPQTSFDHRARNTPVVFQQNDCQVEYDQAASIWGNSNAFYDSLRSVGYPVLFENTDYAVFRISDQVFPLKQIDIHGNTFLFRQTYHPGWMMKIDNTIIRPIETEQGYMSFDVKNILDVGERHKFELVFEPQLLYDKQKWIQLGVFSVAFCLYLGVLWRYRTLQI
jgi:hypothetical protein